MSTVVQDDIGQSVNSVGAGKSGSYVGQISLSEIDRQNKRFQVRSGLDPVTVREYREVAAYRGMETFTSPVILWRKSEKDKFVIVDGWHRVQAAVDLGVKTILAQHCPGMSEKEAHLEAAKANLRHGLRLKTEERIEACCRIVRAMTTEEGTQPSSVQVAEMMGVSEGTVRNYREKLQHAGKLAMPDKISGKNGQLQPARKCSAAGVAGGSSTAETPSTCAGAVPVAPPTPAIGETPAEARSDTGEVQQGYQATWPTPYLCKNDMEVLMLTLYAISNIAAAGLANIPNGRQIAKMLQSIMMKTTDILAQENSQLNG